MRKTLFLVLTLALMGLLCSGASGQVARTNYFHITTDATFLVKPGGGVLTTVCVNTPAATETITIYDNVTATAPVIAVITLFASTNPCFAYNVNFNTGLTVVTATAAGDITIGYQ